LMLKRKDAVALMAQASMFMRPFLVEFGDDRAGLNVFTLQLGASGFGRKGTSSAFADRGMVPRLLNLFRQYETDLNDRSNGAATYGWRPVKQGRSVMRHLRS